MDEMRIGSKLVTGVISKIVKGLLKKKLGYDIDFQLNKINITFTNEKAHVHLDVDTELNKDEFMKILKNVGLS